MILATMYSYCAERNDSSRCCYCSLLASLDNCKYFEFHLRPTCVKDAFYAIDMKCDGLIEKVSYFIRFDLP